MAEGATGSSVMNHPDHEDLIQQNQWNGLGLTSIKQSSKDWEVWTRRIFWALGLFLGIVSAYATRRYVNGDAITYFDMAEAFRLGYWADATNLTYSPGYPVLLAGLGYICKSPNYLFLAKFLNLMCFILAMWACDLFVARSCRSLSVESPHSGLPNPLFAAICYSSFLLSSLGWVRLQVVSPDMMVFALILFNCLLLLKISEQPERLSLYGMLGLVNGAGYIFKTFLFPFSFLFFMLAASWNRSIFSAAARVMFSIAVMLLIASPVLIGQSSMAGKFSYGEAGNYNYSYFVSGTGERINKPKSLHHKPEVLSYDRKNVLTYPKGADPAYWNMGIKPTFDFYRQVSAIKESLDHLFGRIFLPTLAIIVWFVIQCWSNMFGSVRLFPPSPALMFGLICIAGTLMFCLVVMEIRYVAPFIFLGFVALAWIPRYGQTYKNLSSRVYWETGLLVAFLLVIMVESVVDQSMRCVRKIDGKESHNELFMEAEAVSHFMNLNGISRGDKVAIIIPFSQRLYWANLAGVKVTAEFPDMGQFLKCSPKERFDALESLGRAGIKSVVAAHPSLAETDDKRWIRIPGAPNYLAMILNGDSGNSDGSNK